jgi:hypothetical protein
MFSGLRLNNTMQEHFVRYYPSVFNSAHTTPCFVASYVWSVDGIIDGTGSIGTCGRCRNLDHDPRRTHVFPYWVTTGGDRTTIPPEAWIMVNGRYALQICDKCVPRASAPAEHAQPPQREDTSRRPSTTPRGAHPGSGGMHTPKAGGRGSQWHAAGGKAARAAEPTAPQGQTRGVWRAEENTHPNPARVLPFGTTPAHHRFMHAPDAGIFVMDEFLRKEKNLTGDGLEPSLPRTIRQEGDSEDSGSEYSSAGTELGNTLDGSTMKEDALKSLAELAESASEMEGEAGLAEGDLRDEEDEYGDLADEGRRDRPPRRSARETLALKLRDRERTRAGALKCLDIYNKSSTEVQKTLLRVIKDNVALYDGTVDHFQKLSVFNKTARTLVNKVEGDLTMKSLICDRGLRTQQLLDALVSTRVADPLRKQAQAWLRSRKNCRTKTTLRQLLRWIADKVVHLNVAFDEFAKFSVIKQKQGETTMDYWIRFTQTAEALKCFGDQQFEVQQRNQFNAFVHGLRDNLRKLVIPRLANPDGEGGPISNLMQSGHLNKAGIARMWQCILAIIYTMEKILEAEEIRVREMVAGGRRQHTSPFGGGSFRSRDSDRSRSPQHRSISPSSTAYDRSMHAAASAALKAFQPATRRTAPAGRTAQTPTGPRGSSAAPYSRPSKRDASASRSPRRGPPSSDNICNYCYAPDHFWRNCPKKEAAEKSGVNADVNRSHLAKMARCYLMEAAEPTAERDVPGYGADSEAESDTNLESEESASGVDSSGGDSSEFDD